MEIYFEILSGFSKLGLSDFLLKEGYAVLVELDHDVEYKIDTNDKITWIKFSERLDPITAKYVLQIDSIESFEQFKRIVRGEEVARFNSGKPQFTYIDFRLFKYMDKTDFFRSRERHTCISEIKDLVSMLTFDELSQTVIEASLGELQCQAYWLSASYSDIPLPKTAPAYSLKPFESMANVLEFGAKKYERNNWRKPSENKFSTADSLLRHVRDLIHGEIDDQDSGLPHVGHILCNVMFLTYQLIN